jgi:glycosyltransferase involved in cell wall biosynthesis
MCLIYNLFDLYIQYHNSEGFGIPVIEAAACGTPVIATDFSAVCDVVRKVDGVLLGAIDLRGDLHGEVGLVFSRKHAVGDLVKNLSEFGGVVLANGKDDGFTNLSTHRIAQGVFEKSLAEDLISSLREEALFKLALLERLVVVIAFVVLKRNDESLIIEHVNRWKWGIFFRLNPSQMQADTYPFT